MPTMTIYHHGICIDTRTFNHYLFILQRMEDNDIHVETDIDQGNKHEPSIIRMFIRFVGNTPELVNVSPDWEIIIDNHKLERGVYIDIPIHGKKVELSYKEYRFTCIFG